MEIEDIEMEAEVNYCSINNREKCGRGRDEEIKPDREREREREI